MFWWLNIPTEDKFEKSVVHFTPSPETAAITHNHNVRSQLTFIETVQILIIIKYRVIVSAVVNVLNMFMIIRVREI